MAAGRVGVQQQAEENMAVAEERPQHLVALDRANEVRLRAAAIAREIKEAGSYEAAAVIVARLLQDPPADVTLSLRYVLNAVPRLGENTIDRMCQGAYLTGEEILAPTNVQAGIYVLTPRQREAFAGRLLGPPSRRYDPDPMYAGPVSPDPLQHYRACAFCEGGCYVILNEGASEDQVRAKFRAQKRLFPEGVACYTCAHSSTARARAKGD